MTAQSVSLDDKYTLGAGRVYLTGIQALVRLPLAQRQRDRAAGLNTGGFISGYRGSPLGAYDMALVQAKKHLAAENIHFSPGVNEDLAATAIWGSQQLNLTPGATVDGVFGIWYGKGPGVDRTLDVFKHANMAGTDPKGGVLAILGDDHGCQSSTLAHQSEPVLISAMMPVLNPATVQEYLDFGLMGFALSRYSGCWVGFKAVSEAVESSASVSIDPVGLRIVTPEDHVLPAGGLGIRLPDPSLEMERRLHGPKMAAVAAFARANRLDWPVWRTPGARVGIVATGKAYLDVRHALELLGIDERRAGELGLALYKVGLTWPLETNGILAFARGLQEVVVVEEKRGLVEDQVIKALYPLAARPLVVGKTDETGRPLFPSEGELNPLGVACALGKRLLGRLEDPGLRQTLARLQDRLAEPAVAPAQLVRTPFFCSGCPHNTSTRVPDGSRALAGIGCHGMVVAIPERRTGLITHMGGEGATRVGQAPFTTEPHVFQNLGDGTYYHSGILAIRAAAAAGINITYKILFNDAVAMTGGQPHDGPLTAATITQQVWAEGAKKIFVVTDEPDKYPPGYGFAPGTEVRHRHELDAVQRQLRETPGLTVLVYDQACAAEKRRKRKRGLYPDPPKRVFINERVCEGCGDCSAKSNCVSVKPLETEFGRKRQIDQSDCNKDFSCLEGFCPSFVTVHGGAVRKAERAKVSVAHDPFKDLPAPAAAPLTAPYGILVTGIGGTGVITVGALMGMAAHIEGKGCTVLDFTGLAQKNGSVMSHVRLSPHPEQQHAVRLAEGEADVVVACDMLVAASAGALSRMDKIATHAVVNDHLQPTAEFVRNGDLDLGAAGARRAIRAAAGEDAEFVDATRLATALMGDSIATNLFMLGFAWQKGLIPLGGDAILQAIELNGVAVEANKQTFAWGRLAAHDPKAVEAAAGGLGAIAAEPPSLQALVEARAADLTLYQDAAYATRYRRIVEVARAAEARLPGQEGFAIAVARNLYKLMAYKDEYEVARLFSDGDFRRRVQAQFEGNYRLQFHLAPPLFAARDSSTGELRKRAYGAWVTPVFALLAKARGLRGTPLDPFGYTEERRTERQLIVGYEALVAEMASSLSARNHAAAVQLADWPQAIRGYGHVKVRSLALAHMHLDELTTAFRMASAPRTEAA